MHCSTSFAWFRRYRRALELDPNYPLAHHRYAMALGTLGRHDDALAAIRHARELDPTELMIHGNSALLLYWARRYDEAIAEAENAVAMDRSFAVNRYRLGLVFQAKGLYARAIAEYEGMNLSASDPLGWAALAHAFSVMGRAADAEEILETLLAVSKQRYVSAVFFAEIRAGLGCTDEALSWLELGLDGRPSWTSASSDAERRLTRCSGMAAGAPRVAQSMSVASRRAP